jgi:uncharacterized protein (DUF3820 family)
MLKESNKYYEFTILTFGKYKGKYIKDVPTSYIRWAGIHISNPGISHMFLLELERRLLKVSKQQLSTK